MRILCPTYWYPASASDTDAIYVHDINRYLVNRGHAVRVVTPSAKNLAIRDEFDGVEIFRFRLKLPAYLSYGKVAQSRISQLRRLGRIFVMARYFMAQLRATLKEAHSFKADVLHAHWAIPTGPAAVIAARRLGIPAIITMHGGDVYVNVAQGYNFPTLWYVRPVLRWTLRQASALTAITEDCRRHALRAGARDEQIHVIMNGADLKRFSPPDAAIGEKHLPFGPRMIFTCRQLLPRKGVRFLIEAAARLKARFPDLKLMIAGDGLERPDLEKLAQNLGISGDTTFLGWVENKDLPQYYRAAAICVIPSLEEGFGIPAVEAMGCGVPVIASDAGGLIEVIEDGVTGRLVPKGDVDALVSAMEELLLNDHLRQKMGKAGRERALRLFDWNRSAEQFESLYYAMVRNRT